MKYLFIALLSFGFISCESNSKTPENMVQKSVSLSVMTYNIRLDIASDKENAWANRKDFLISQVRFHAPDIFGVQEARPNQMQDLKLAFKDYKAIGMGRDGEQQGEFSAIFYNTKKVKVENKNTFWLSETPNKVSKGWDAAYPRICTYGLFTMLENSQRIWVFNTHLDHIGNLAQRQGMRLIQNKIEALNTSKLPVILMGDFNVPPTSNLIGHLKNSMNDAKDITPFAFGPNATFNGFKFNAPAFKRIDYIFLSKSDKFKVAKYGVLSSVLDLKYPSDHFPVFVELNF